MIPSLQGTLKASGRGVRVGLLDTGVASMHPQLRSANLKNYEVSATSPWHIERLGEGKDYRDHGTACAGILHRHAPDAEIHSVCVINDSRDELLQRLIAGLRFAIAQQWDVINFSLGTRIDSPELAVLCDKANQAGQILIAAKDNEGSVAGYPAAYPSVIGVDMDHFDAPLEFAYDPGEEIELTANGVYIAAPQPGGGTHHYTGTSYACPHVSAVAARLRELASSMTTSDFRQVLATSRRPAHQP
ncbi:MAG: S8 family serine peptidase [Verrucomicrobiota bacterium]